MAGAARTSSARAFDVGTIGGILGNGFLKLDIQKKKNVFRFTSIRGIILKSCTFEGAVASHPDDLIKSARPLCMSE